MGPDRYQVLLCLCTKWEVGVLAWFRQHEREYLILT